MPAPKLPLSRAATARLNEAVRQTKEEADAVDAKLIQTQDDLKKMRASGVSSAALEGAQKRVKMLKEQKKSFDQNALAQNIDTLNEKDQAALMTRFEKAVRSLIKVIPQEPSSAIEDALRVLSKLSATTESKQDKVGANFQNIPPAFKKMEASLKHTEDLVLTQSAVGKMEEVIGSLKSSIKPSSQKASANYPLKLEREKYAKQLYKSVKNNLENITDLDPVTDMSIVALYFKDATDLAKLATLILEGNPSKIANLYDNLDTAASEVVSVGATDFIEETMRDKSVYAIKTARAPKR